jgi:hypothetical protein
VSKALGGEREESLGKHLGLLDVHDDIAATLRATERLAVACRLDADDHRACRERVSVRRIRVDRRRL